MPISCRIAALLVVLVLALPAAAGAQSPMPTQTLPSQDSGSSRPPVDLGGGGEDAEDGRSDGRDGAGSSSPPRSPASSSLPDTGSDPRLLFLTGVALAILGAGLRLRTADADVY